MNKIILSVVLAAILGVAIWGGYQYPKVRLGAASPSGSTFGDAKVAEINMVPSSAAATSSSILNTDGSDRIVTDAFVSCSNLGNVFTAVTGAGLTSGGWVWRAATSSTAAPAVLRAGSDLAMNVSVATTTVSDAYTATSTYTLPYTQRWAAGSYMTFQPNATSSSASCSVGVHYIGT